jgi:chitinase
MSDHKQGLVSRSELHERWFGKSVIEWLKGLFTHVEVDVPIAEHEVTETLQLLLLQEQFQCNYKGVDVEARLDISATASLQMETSFGLTIITTLGVKPDMSQSYLYLRNKGKITTIFNIDALVQAMYSTGDIELFGLQNFNALFGVPGIVTVVSVAPLRLLTRVLF